MRGRGTLREVKRAAGNQRREVAEAIARATGLRVAIFSCTGVILEELKSSRLAAAVPWIVFVFLALVTWNRWLEPYVDSGRELMVPRRLAQGERLWSDVQFFHGPLGPYLAAIVEGIAAPSLPARTALCAAVAAAHLLALQLLARRWLSPWRGALALSVAVATAVFLRPGGWLFPFSLDVAIAVAALTAAVAGATRDPQPADATAGAGVLA